MDDIIVLGSINMDIVASMRRAPLPGETVFGDTLAYLPGGKGANQAVAAARAGAHVRMIGKVGNDPFATTLLDFLKTEGIDLSCVGKSRTAPSGTAIITLDGKGENSITVIPGSNGEVSPADVAACALSKDLIAVAQFEVPLETVKAFFTRAKATGARTILNTAPALPCDRDILKLADIIVLNETECAFYAGAGTGDIAAARALLTSPGQAVILTLGAEGLVIVDGRRDVKISGHTVNPVDTTGAGDCFTGNLAAALAEGLGIDAAARRANAAAALSVQKAGAGPAMPLASQTDEFMRMKKAI